MRDLFSGNEPELVLFDLDGTLVDSVPDLSRAVDRMLLSLNRPPAGEEAVSHWVGNGAAVLVKRALAGAVDYGEVDGDLFDIAYQRFLDFYAEATAEHSQLYPGVEVCLSGLRARGISLGLITNKPISFTETMLQGFGLRDYFSVVIGGDSLAEKKPHPMPLLEAMSRCQATAESTLMVGDSVHDVKAARAAGCPIACVPYGYNHGVSIALAEPDKVLTGLEQLLD
ncbi:phosphoglycolate phosphatase [Neptuniibacter halophilus]|uniref:phosphoglycolate phosphatase n=1 Tax=Neptuniibacter halophilus TaxID=651666 RepID=UPI002572A549|nr:phosphoglycolate phosphatase [Neptuniibacter halophilus]